MEEKGKLEKIFTIKFYFQIIYNQFIFKVLKEGCQDPPTKPKGRPKKNSIPSLSDIIKAAESAASNNSTGSTTESLSSSVIKNSRNSVDSRSNSSVDEDEDSDDEDDDDDDDNIELSDDDENEELFSDDEDDNQILDNFRLNSDKFLTLKKEENFSYEKK